MTLAIVFPFKTLFGQILGVFFFCITARLSQKVTKQHEWFLITTFSTYPHYPTDIKYFNNKIMYRSNVRDFKSYEQRDKSFLRDNESYKRHKLGRTYNISIRSNQTMIN